MKGKTMQEPEKSLLTIVLIGALIGLGKLLASDEVLTIRLLLGRTLMGAATSMVAGVAVLHIPDMPLIAMFGIAAALGIAGSQALELLFKHYLDRKGN